MNENDEPAQRRYALLHPDQKAEISGDTRSYSRIGTADIEPNNENGGDVNQGVHPVDKEHHDQLQDELFKGEKIQYHR